LINKSEGKFPNNSFTKQFPSPHNLYVSFN
jgi:hypothetical protein